jgi:membrane protein involved in colicin uptake
MAELELDIEMPTDVDSNGDETASDQPDEMSSVEYWKSRARQHERAAKANADAVKRASEAERRLAELENAGKPDNEKEIERVRAEAANQARTEAMEQANQRILKSELRAAAAGKLADPEDAVRFLDIEDFVVGDEGEVDTKALTQAVAGLLKEKPYLAAEAVKRKHGDGDGGARGRSATSNTMNDILRSSTSRGRFK